MPFGLKNAGATYRREMNAIFHDMIGRFVEVYIDDIVIKSQTEEEHLSDLRRTFERMRKYKLKMNPLKCAFGVSAGNFLGFLIHQRGIEVDKNKARAIIEAKPPQNKKELQQLLGQVNFLRRFIANCAGKPRDVLQTLAQTQARRGISVGRSSPGGIRRKKKVSLESPCYHATDQGQATEVISAARNSIGSFRVLTPVEQRYTPIEKLCLTLYFSSQKWRVYMLPVMVFVICQTDIIKYLLSRPIMSGRLGKWAFALMEFTFQYRPQRAVKGQALASFLASHPCLDIDPEILRRTSSNKVRGILAP
ncbi:hypothetical protein NE237_031354 [Protea cynaroides]|uniref:Reverse transcriptase domain-containing protein n=1 Tax=Protea cynaroides TaxID=273540 RepID=A0A9Q0R2F1_9MAGN|nr:hypothetical protein NE237_031354 [Protea cynaroides]